MPGDTSIVLRYSELPATISRPGDGWKEEEEKAKKEVKGRKGRGERKAVAVVSQPERRTVISESLVG